MKLLGCSSPLLMSVGHLTETIIELWVKVNSIKKSKNKQEPALRYANTKIKVDEHSRHTHIQLNFLAKL